MTLANKFKMKLNTKEASNKFIPVVTANDTTIFEFEVYDGKDEIELLETYNFNFVTKPVGKGSVLYPAELNEDGNVIVELNFADVNHGHCDCALVMYEGEKRVSTMRMKVDVKGDLSLQGDLPSESRRLIIADEALLMKAVAAAEDIEDVVGENGSLAELLANVGGSNDKKEFPLQWEIGSIHGNGTDIISDIRYRTVGRIIPSIYGVLDIKVPNGLKVMVGVYNTNGNYGSFNETFYPNSFEFEIQPNREYRLIVGKNGDAALTLAEVQGVSVTGYLNKLTKNIYKSNEDVISAGYMNDLNNISMWESGSFETDTGALRVTPTRLRTKDFIPENVSKVKAKTGFLFTQAVYNKTTGDFIRLDGTFKSELELNPNFKYRLVLRSGVSTSTNIFTGHYQEVMLLAGQINDVRLREVTKLKSYTDSLNQAKGVLGLNLLEQRLESNVTRHIETEGLKINGVNKTRAEIKDWILNRNNCKYRGKLKKKGKYLVDQFDKPIEIQGIGTHHMLQYKDLHTYDVLKTLKYYGVNCLRLTAYPSTRAYRQSFDEVSPGYLSTVTETREQMDKLIEYCIDLGLYVIVDWHVLDYDNVDASTSEAVAFFEYFCSKYATVPNVLYELLNEPFNNTIQSLAPFILATTTEIKKHVTDPILILGKGSSSIDNTHNWLITNGYNDIFLSHHFYPTSYGDPAAEYQRLYDAGIPMFCTEWGNAELSGDGPTNDAVSTAFLNKLHELCIPHCVWKLTHQDMTTSVLKYNIAGWEDKLYQYGGFIDSDLSHNGKLYFDKFADNAFENWIERTAIE